MVDTEYSCTGTMCLKGCPEARSNQIAQDQYKDIIKRINYPLSRRVSISQPKSMAVDRPSSKVTII